jgi:hypothetical protein
VNDNPQAGGPDPGDPPDPDDHVRNARTAKAFEAYKARCAMVFVKNTRKAKAAMRDARRKVKVAKDLGECLAVLSKQAWRLGLFVKVGAYDCSTAHSELRLAAREVVTITNDDMLLVGVMIQTRLMEAHNKGEILDDAASGLDEDDKKDESVPPNPGNPTDPSKPQIWWLGGLTKDGVPKINMPNTRAVLMHLGCRCSFNRFKHRFIVEGPTAFEIRKGESVNLNIGEIGDLAITQLRGIIAKGFFDPGSTHTLDAVMDFGLEHQFHPVLDYLDGLTWDQQPRIDSWLTKTFGVRHSDYVSAVGSIFLVAAVRRVRQPGCKFDTAMVLEGHQGSGRSEALAILAVNPEWFSDVDVPGLPMKEQIELTEGV